MLKMETRDTAERNQTLKQKFQKLHKQLVAVDLTPVIDALFSEAILSSNDVRRLLAITDRKCRATELLLMLHDSVHPQSFIHLLQAISNEPTVSHIVDKLDTVDLKTFAVPLTSNEVVLHRDNNYQEQLMQLEQICDYIINYLYIRGVISSYDELQLRGIESYKTKVNCLLELLNSCSDPVIREQLWEAIVNEREPSFSWFTETSSMSSPIEAAETEASLDDDVRRLIRKLSSQLVISPITATATPTVQDAPDSRSLNGSTTVVSKQPVVTGNRVTNTKSPVPAAVTSVTVARSSSTSTNTTSSKQTKDVSTSTVTTRIVPPVSAVTAGTPPPTTGCRSLRDHTPAPPLVTAVSRLAAVTWPPVPAVTVGCKSPKSTIASPTATTKTSPQVPAASSWCKSPRSVTPKLASVVTASFRLTPVPSVTNGCKSPKGTTSSPTVVTAGSTAGSPPQVTPTAASGWCRSPKGVTPALASVVTARSRFAWPPVPAVTNGSSSPRRTTPSASAVATDSRPAAVTSSPTSAVTTGCRSPKGTSIPAPPPVTACAGSSLARDCGDAIVIDNGSYKLKAGLAGSDTRFACLSSVDGKRALVSCVVKDSYIGGEPEVMRKGILTLSSPTERAIVTNWDDMEMLWHQTFDKELHFNPSDRSVLLTEPPNNPKRKRENVTQVLFEKFEVPAMFIAHDSTASLYASEIVGRTALVVSSGFSVTHCTPVYEGHSLQYAASSMDLAGHGLTQYLAQLMKTSETLETISDIKEKLCYVAMDFHIETKSAQNKPSSLSKPYKLPDGGMINIGRQRFQCPEALFQPSLANLDVPGIHQMIIDSINKCNPDIREKLYENILLAGGSTMFPGIAERLQKEVTALAPAGVKVKIIAPSHRKYAAWIGGSMLSAMTHFHEMWISRYEYDEIGPNIVHRKCF